MKGNVLVSGANGHLGNNLVRALAARGEPVIAGMRNIASDALADVDCERVPLDLLDRDALLSALRDVDVFYQVGAVFRQWSRNPEQDIYEANLQGTRNAIEAAARAGVRRVVYVSSLVALDRSVVPVTENSWNPNRDNVYARSKTDSEKLAWELAGRHGVEMVAVLPGAIVGRNCFRLTPTMKLLAGILRGELPVDPGFHFNFVDVEDIADGMIAAAERGRNGERYLLANENCMDIGRMVSIAKDTFPERRIREPRQVPGFMLNVLATVMETAGRIRGREPELQRSYLTEFTHAEQCDISKARDELDFKPRLPEAAVADAYRYLDAQARVMKPAGAET